MMKWLGLVPDKHKHDWQIVRGAIRPSGDLSFAPGWYGGLSVWFTCSCVAVPQERIFREWERV